MLLRHRIHEWFADRFTWVQYPNIRADMQRRAQRGQPTLRWEQRLGLGLIGVFGLLVSGFMLVVSLFVLWAFLVA